MSVTPLSLDVSAPLAQGKPVEKREGGNENVNLRAVLPGKRPEEKEKSEEVQQEEAPKPVINVLDPGLEFTLDQETGLTIVRMYDRESGELIRQLPPEETLAFLRRLAEDKKGVLVSKKL